MKNDTENKFEEYREYLGKEVTRLVSNIEIFRRLHHRRVDRLEEMNLAPAFFGTVTDAIFSEIVIWADKLFDDRGERGLFNFLQFIENNQGIFSVFELKRRRNYPVGHWMLKRDPIDSSKIQEHREKLKNYNGRKAIEILRDKYYGHFDRKYFFDRDLLKKDGELQWNEFDEMVEILDDIMNYYSTAFDGNAYQFKPMNIEDIDGLLDILHKCRLSRQEI